MPRRKTPRSRLHKVQKAISFLQEPLETRVNSKYQSKGPIYILHLLPIVEIRLFNVFFWERDSREKGAGSRDPICMMCNPKPSLLSFFASFCVLVLSGDHCFSGNNAYVCGNNAVAVYKSSQVNV